MYLTWRWSVTCCIWIISATCCIKKLFFTMQEVSLYFLDMKVKCNLLHQMNNCYLVCQNFYFNARNHTLFSLIKHFTFHAYELWLSQPIKSQVHNRHNNNCKHMLSLEGSFSSILCVGDNVNEWYTSYYCITPIQSHL